MIVSVLPAYSSRPSSGYSYGWNSETTLWTNSSPTSNYTGGSVSLSYSLSNYSYLKFYFRLNTTTSTEIVAIYPRSYFTGTSGNGVGRCAAACINTGGSQVGRCFYYESSTSVKFTNGFNTGSGSGAPTYVIPTKITGLS